MTHRTEPELLTRCTNGTACPEVTARLQHAEIASRAIHPAAGTELRYQAARHAFAHGLGPRPERPAQ